MGIEFGRFRNIPEKESSTDASGALPGAAGKAMPFTRPPESLNQAGAESRDAQDLDALRPGFRKQIIHAFFEAEAIGRDASFADISEREAGEAAVIAAQIRDVSDDTTIRFPEETDFRGVVTTTDPLAYRVLLEEAYGLFNDADPETVAFEVERAYRHEMAHAAPALAEESLKVVFGFKIQVNPEGDISTNTAIHVNGVTTVGTFRRIIAGPSELSEVDEILLAGHDHDHYRDKNPQ